MDITKMPLSGQTRPEHDLIGDMEVPVEYYFGVQTLRAMENFKISRSRLSFYPEFVVALAEVKEAAALANRDLDMLDPKITDAIVAACAEIKGGKLHDHFVVDMMQGGAGTSTNMNANEVIANRALEILGHSKGDYKYCHPNNHVNLSQSTNDAYPTSLQLALYRSVDSLIEALKALIAAFEAKSTEFADVIKMGRTQLQDAVPMTLGQEFRAFADTLAVEISSLERVREQQLEINMGATAIGTGINSDPDYPQICADHLVEITGLKITVAKNMVQATSDTGSILNVSGTLKAVAVKLSRISNDLRLLASGPRTGLGEINLPPMQPGSSIMPGKVNPVIPEVVNQIAFRVIGGDMTVSMASEAAQLQLNVMEPVMAFTILENIEMLINGMNTLKDKCVVGITANAEHTHEMVMNSIGLVTALNPYLGYENSSIIAADALKTGRSVYDLVLEHKMMDQEELDEVLKPENMVMPRKFPKK